MKRKDECGFILQLQKVGLGRRLARRIESVQVTTTKSWISSVAGRRLERRMESVQGKR